MFPFIDTAPRAARPLAVIALILGNSLIFLWMLGLPAEALNAVLVHYALIPLRYTHPALARSVGLDPDNFWPFLTDAFLHGGWWHIIFNMWFLWIFGPAMEARFGRLGFLALYLGGAAAASAVHVATHPDSAEPVLGASGAIAAVIAAYALIYPTERVVTIVPVIFIPLFVPVPAMIFAAIWFALQVMQGTQELGQPAIAAGVAWWAHIGGFAFGALFALLARALAFEMQTPIDRWSDMYERRTRGRRVPDVRPRDGQEW
ncbi:MAG: rhomboid family intramembrane serine protease [Pseudolabrys sp.]|nr:rhomboid family intramembrane serine protease [Pseudolabrys sp.]